MCVCVSERERERDSHQIVTDSFISTHGVCVFERERKIIRERERQIGRERETAKDDEVSVCVCVCV